MEKRGSRSASLLVARNWAGQEFKGRGNVRIFSQYVPRTARAGNIMCGSVVALLDLKLREQH